MQDLPLVLLPGMDGSGVMFRPLLDVLPENVRAQVVIYPPNVAHYAELLPLVLEKLPSHEPCVLVAESFSGPLAVMVAVACPERIAGLVLVASFLRNPQRWIPGWLSRFVVPEMFNAVPRSWRSRIMLGSRDTPGLRSLLDQALDFTPAKTILGRMIQVQRANVHAEFARLTMPVLYLRGAAGRLVPAWNGDEVAELQPHAELQTLPAPHLVLQTMPREAANCISQFILRIVGEQPDLIA